MVIFELRTHTGKKASAIVGTLLGLLSLSTMFSKFNIFSEREATCVILSSAFWGVLTLCAHLKTNHPFCLVLGEASFYLTLLLLIGVSVSLYTSI